MWRKSLWLAFVGVLFLLGFEVQGEGPVVGQGSEQKVEEESQEKSAGGKGRRNACDTLEGIQEF